MDHPSLTSILATLRRRSDEPLLPRRVHEIELAAAIEALRGSSDEGEALAALLHLWNDDLERSHEISQQLPTATGSYLHGVMHRREGDYSNACYWFRRCADHPIRERLGQRLAATPRESRGDTPEVLWKAMFDPARFVAACEESPDDAGLRRVQRHEFEVMLELLRGAP